VGGFNPGFKGIMYFIGYFIISVSIIKNCAVQGHNAFLI